MYEYSGILTIHDDTFSSTSVNMSWTESPSHCGPVIYRYSILPGSELVESSTSNNVAVDVPSPSDDPYCITVSVIYIYNTTSTTNEQCFLFQGNL